MEFLGRLYARRIVNINVNIIAAGMMAMGLTLIPVYLTRHAGIDSKTLIVGITLGFDVCFDVAIYYLLHWLANHWSAFPWVKHRRPHPGRLSFIRDASLVQFERALLGPVYYGVALGLQYILLHNLDDGNDRRELATALGLGAGLLITRAMHTGWMLFSERRWRRKAALTGKCPKCGNPVPLHDAACPLCGIAEEVTAGDAAQAHRAGDQLA
jgi:hypothetical protein